MPLVFFWFLSYRLNGNLGAMMSGFKEVWIASSWQLVLSGTFLRKQILNVISHLASVFVRGRVEAGTDTKGHSFLVSISKPQLTPFQCWLQMQSRWWRAVSNTLSGGGGWGEISLFSVWPSQNFPPALKVSKSGTREMAQQLKVLAALLKGSKFSSQHPPRVALCDL